MSSICKFLLDIKYATVITKIYVNLTLENYGVILSEYLSIIIIVKMRSFLKPYKKILPKEICLISTFFIKTHAKGILKSSHWCFMENSPNYGINSVFTVASFQN